MDQAGVIEVLTKVLVNLYEEPDKPDQAIEFIKTKLGAPTTVEFDALVKEKEGLESKVAELEEQLKVLSLAVELLPKLYYENEGAAINYVAACVECVCV